MTLAAGAVLVLVLIVTIYPASGAYLLLAVTPLVAGIGRGVVVPIVRPNEALLLLVVFGLLLHLLVTPAWGRRKTASLYFHRFDGAIVLLAISGSVLPLLWMVVRGRTITQTDIFYALQLWKYYAVFLVVRMSVVTSDQVGQCLKVVLVSSCLVALIAILQSRQLFGLPALLHRVYSPTEQIINVNDKRGSATLGNTFAVGDIMVFSLAIAAAWIAHGSRHRTRLTLIAGLLLLGAVASGEVSSFVGIIVGAFAVGFVLRRLGRTLVLLGVSAFAAAIALWPVIQARLNGFNNAYGLPVSWVGRLHNLQTFFWPQLGQSYNWLTGVRPTARVPTPLSLRYQGPWIWIESGHTWLLWTGGVVFLVAYFVYVIVTMRGVLGIARQRKDIVGVAATGSFAALAVTAVLMTFDVHLTLRGAAELSFGLLALALPKLPVKRGDVPRISRSGTPRNRRYETRAPGGG